MCQTVAYLLDQGKETALLQDVVIAIPEAGTIRLVNLFGEEKVVEGRIKQIDLLTHRIVIQAGGTP